MADERPPVQTHIRKIIIGTPVRKVTGAQAQSLADLVDISGLNDSGGYGATGYDLMQFDFAMQKWVFSNYPDGLTIAGGGKGVALSDSAGGDF